MENRELSAVEVRLADTIDDVFAELTQVDPGDCFAMSESRFHAIFLPMFAGDTPLMYPATIDMWQSLAGGPFKEVRIVDNRNQTLFMVPPLFDKEGMSPLTGTGQAEGLSSMVQVLDRANMYSRQGKARMDWFLNGELDRRSFMFKNKANEDEFIRRWNEIFVRYGRPPIAITADPAGKPVVKTESDLASDEFESF